MKNEISVIEFSAKQGAFHRHLLSEACEKNFENLKEGNFENNWLIIGCGTPEECEVARDRLIAAWGDKAKKYLNKELLEVG